MVKLVFLGRLADLAGGGEGELAAIGPVAWDGLMELLAKTYSDRFVEEIAGRKVRIAVNGTVLEDKHSLLVENGDEVAFLPPVSGG